MILDIIIIVLMVLCIISISVFIAYNYVIRKRIMDIDETKLIVVTMLLSSIIEKYLISIGKKKLSEINSDNKKKLMLYEEIYKTISNSFDMDTIKLITLTNDNGIKLFIYNLISETINKIINQ